MARFYNIHLANIFLLTLFLIKVTVAAVDEFVEETKPEQPSQPANPEQDSYDNIPDELETEERRARQLWQPLPYRDGGAIDVELPRPRSPWVPPPFEETWGRGPPRPRPLWVPPPSEGTNVWPGSPLVPPIVATRWGAPPWQRRSWVPPQFRGTWANPRRDWGPSPLVGSWNSPSQPRPRPAWVAPPFEGTWDASSIIRRRTYVRNPSAWRVRSSRPYTAPTWRSRVDGRIRPRYLPRRIMGARAMRRNPYYF